MRSTTDPTEGAKRVRICHDLHACYAYDLVEISWYNICQRLIERAASLGACRSSSPVDSNRLLYV